MAKALVSSSQVLNRSCASGPSSQCLWQTQNVEVILCFLAERTGEVGEVWFSLFFWNLPRADRLKGLGERARYLSASGGEELFRAPLPANCHRYNDRLPAGVQHLPRRRVLLGNDDPDGQQSYEEGAHQRIHVCLAL